MKREDIERLLAAIDAVLDVAAGLIDEKHLAALRKLRRLLVLTRTLAP